MLTSLLISGIIVSGVGISYILNKNENTSTTKESEFINFAERNESNYSVSSNSKVNREESKKVDYAKETYNYLKYLSTDEIKDYVKTNYKLSENDYKIYGTCNKDNKDLVIKHICDLAEKEERSFTNKYSRY